MSMPRLTDRQTLITVVAAAFLTSLCPDLAACECAPPPPPCEAYADTQIVFLGTVTKLDKGIATMRVDRAYKGINKPIAEFWQTAMCPGPSFQVGEQYVMYTGEDGSGYLPAGGCSRSRHVSYAKEDLAFLNGLSKAPATSTVFGTVTAADDGDIYQIGKPAPGVVVSIDGQDGRRKATTDKEGHYAFEGLRPGEYRVDASLPGYTQLISDADNEVEVIARGCRVADVALRKNWAGAITGRVTRANGTAGPAGINVDLIQVGNDVKSQLWAGLTVETDDQGEYSFRNVPPGHYKVVLNVYKPPTSEYPFRTLYWPAASTEASASAVEINEDAQRRDFRLPAPLKSALIKFVVLLPDGTPARDAHANILTRLEFGAAGAGEATTNFRGEFSFGAIAGLEYTVRDILTFDARMLYDVPFSAADAGRTVTIRLVKQERR